MARARYSAERDFKKRVRRNKRRRRITLFVLLCITFFCVVYLLPVFNISEGSVSVMGADRTAESVGNYAKTLAGKNINWYSMEGIERTIEGLPYIKKATVTRHFPNRVKIEVEESRQVAHAKSGDVDFLIDDGGKVIDSSYEIFSFASELKGIEQEFVVGGFIKDEIKLANYRAVVAKLIEDNLQVSSIDLSDDKNIKFKLGGLEVQVGENVRMDYKFKMLAEIREQVGVTIKGELDLRNGSKAYFREIYR